ncbi:MAG: lytic transglycosylase domain-containing protein [Flavobacteriales bacterium]|nr:lytic transglycosylase domain-containing protein [Flavobacteriales bacterium]
MNKSLKIVSIAVGFVLFAVVILAISSTKEIKENNTVFKNQNDDFSDHYRIATPPIPEVVDFAGEVVPLDDWDVRERLERELLTNVYWQSNTLLNLKRSRKYFQTIETILAKNGIPDDFKYLAVAESGLINAVSSAGAKGIWQFMESSAQSYGLTVNTEIDERYHLEKSTQAACDYLKHSKATLGSWTLSAAAYNRGVAGTVRDKSDQKQNNYYDLYLNTETSRYVFRIIAFKLIMQNPDKYGFSLSDDDYFKPEKTYLLNVDTTIVDLADFAIQNGTSYKMVKLLNPWLRDDHLTIKTGQGHVLKMPE